MGIGTLIGTVGMAAAAAAAVAAGFTGWGAAAVVFGVVAIGGAVIAVVLRWYGAEPAETVSEAPAEEPPPRIEEPEIVLPHRRKHVFQRELPSARPEFGLLFSAIVCWRGPDLEDRVAEAAAVDSVVERARAFAGRTEPDAVGGADEPLVLALGAGGGCGHPGVWDVWAEEVRLEMVPADAERLQRLRELRKQKAERAEQRELERDERDYLGADALAAPGTALVWWLSRNPDRIDEAVDRISMLATLSSAATGNSVPDHYRDLAAERRPVSWYDPAGAEHGPSGGISPDSSSGAEYGGTEDSEPEPAEEGPESGGDTGAVLRALRLIVNGLDEDAALRHVDQTAEDLAVGGRADLAAAVRAEFGCPDAWSEAGTSPNGGRSSGSDGRAVAETLFADGVVSEGGEEAGPSADTADVFAATAESAPREADEDDRSNGGADGAWSAGEVPSGRRAPERAGE